MVIHTLPCGDKVHRFDGSIVVPFEGKRKVLSTALHNGGYREDLKAVFNRDLKCHPGVPAELKAPTYREHLVKVIEELGLDPETTAGLETAAQMENASIKRAEHGELTVTAIVTGGIDVNGGRAGDPASYVEEPGAPPEHRAGTINIILAIDADMPPGAMARALVTCTEAKTVAIQELQAPSRYSRGTATGSGTDGVIIVCNALSPRFLTDAGKHSKLGELIARAVIPAVKEALFLQTGLCADRQRSALSRLERFGVSEAGLYSKYLESRAGKGGLARPDFSERLERLARASEEVTRAALVSHLVDEMDWGLLTVDSSLDAARALISPPGGWADMRSQSADEALSEIIHNWSMAVFEKIEAM